MMLVGGVGIYHVDIVGGGGECGVGGCLARCLFWVGKIEVDGFEWRGRGCG